MGNTDLRPAGPNEKRVITRHHLGFYGNLVVCGIYTIPEALIPVANLNQRDIYVPALTECVQRHPFLSATIRDAGSNSPVYTKPSELNLENHLRLLQPEDLGLSGAFEPGHESILLNQILQKIQNDSRYRFASVATVPAWAVVVLPLSSRGVSQGHRLLIGFTYSHSHGDGMTGTIFHQTFHAAFARSLQDDIVSRRTDIEPSSASLPAQPDTASTMPISLSYLLRPALGTYLPRFLARLLGLTGDVSGADDRTWTGSKTFTDDTTPGSKATTSVEILNVEAETLARVLTLCRTNDIKLTALLSLVIAQAFRDILKSHINDPTSYTNLVASIPVNLRKVVGATENTVGNYGGGAYLRYELENLDTNFDEHSWHLVRKHGIHLARVAANPRDQPVGLLRYVSNFPSWMRGQLGKPHSASWELSNLGTFNSSSVVGSDQAVKIEQMFFSQPTGAVGPVISFDSISTMGGSLTMCISWQPGALSLSDTRTPLDLQTERTLVQQIVASVTDRLQHLAQMS